MRYRIMLRTRRGQLVDVPSPLMPGTTGLTMCGPDKKTVQRNLRALGVGLVGVVLMELDENDRMVAETREMN